MKSARHMPRLVKAIRRYTRFNLKDSLFGLSPFSGQNSSPLFTRRNRCKPLFAKGSYVFNGNVTCNYQNRIVGNIMAEEKLLHVVHRSVFDVTDLFYDSCPLVRMHLIGKRSQF